MVTVFVVAAPHALARQLTRQPCGRGSGRSISPVFPRVLCSLLQGGTALCCLALWCVHGGGKPLPCRRHPVRLAYQPPTSSTFLSEQTSYQTFLSEQISTSHQPNEEAGVQQTSSCLAL
jgi:hypothetical protein